jgi:hypothetical protein|eukprot:COSAG06_NODE_575_length_14056_cov_25.763345_17_plen_368_part_00
MASEAPRPTVSIGGRIVARRLLGKHLAFATLQEEEEQQRAAGTAAAALSAGAAGSSGSAPAPAAGPERGAEWKLCFRRQGSADDVWDDASEAPFPARRSLLQVGSLVTVEVVPAAPTAAATAAEPAAVVRWVIHEQGGGRAAGRIPTVRSCLPCARAAADLLLQCCSASLRCRVAALCMQDATAVPLQLAPAAEDAVGLCGAWALLGTCGSSGACPYRHAFGSAQERATAQKLRARNERQASVAEAYLARLQAAWRPAGGTLVRVPWCIQSINPSVVASKDSRAALFARFLVETYGVEYLRSGSGVLDIAGGAKNALFSQLFLCLSRACLGKMIAFIYKLLKKGVFRRAWGPLTCALDRIRRADDCN